MKKLFRLFCLIILIIAIWFITDLTTNILNNRGVKEEIKTKEYKTIQKISRNQTNNMLSDVFNIYLNEERYKVKIDYIINTLEDETSNLELKIYFDGKEIVDKTVIASLNPEIEDYFNDLDIMQNILFTENNFKIVNSDKDYLFIMIGYLEGYGEYYLFNNKGSLLTTKGLMAYDKRVEYIDTEGNDLEIFYDEEASRLKIENNEVLVLELVEEKSLTFNEYKYIINNNKIEKELINTYENISIKETSE